MSEKRFTLKAWLLTGVCVCALCGCAQLPRQTTVPDLCWQLTPEAVEPGHLARVSIHSQTPGLVFSLQGLQQNIPLLPLVNARGQYEGFLAVPIKTRPGTLSLTLTARAADALPFHQVRSFMVKPRSPFKTVRLWIKHMSIYDFAGESRVMAGTRQQDTSKEPGPRLEKFAWPVRGRVSEVFGVKRIYNQGVKSWYHGGLDIAAPGGTPIAAPREGTVILTEPFEAHGNTVMIDHGYGVVSTYLHMKQIYVTPGQELAAGDIIGEVGTTGASTGNHVHFQINVNGIKVDPVDFLEGRI